ncbi:MAG: glycosyltransferase family 39 protein [Anaerolineae bacterium]|nr:glycosyltransferase family 39 protein [Anaerolineae bacterium]
MLTHPIISHLSRLYLWPFFLLLAANSLIFSPIPPILRYFAALILLAFLPGWVWLNVFHPQEQAPKQSEPENLPLPGEYKVSPLLDIAERLTLAAGLSLALTIFGAMFAVYLPGPLDLPRLLLIIDALILIGLVILWWQLHHSVPPPPSPSPSWRPRLLASSLLLLTALLFLAAFLRLPRLGYAEFHEDEVEALMLGVRLLQGEDYALFLHRKGPAQMLIPLAVWLLTGQITEAMARFPFALSSILSVATLFFIGRRWFNWQAGAIAALLWTVNGYSIAFGRMVQYQALIFFWGPLALSCLYLAGVEGRKNGRLEGWRRGKWLILGAILLAACLLAHFDALLLLPAAAYLGWVVMSREAVSEEGFAQERRSGGEKNSPLPPRPPAPLLFMALIALTLFLSLLASFYIPYFLDPEFKNTADYLAGSRVKPGFIYNNLGLLSRLDKDYSSQFYLPLLGLGLTGFVFWPGLRRKWNEAFASVEARAAWLMFGVGFIGYVFLVDDPRTHLYIMYPGAALLAGAGWKILDFRFWILDLRFKLLQLLGSLFFIVFMGLIICYTAIIFLLQESTLDRLRQQWDGSNWLATIYQDLPEAREYFGYPKREGWKAIGALRAQGLFPGDFRGVNEDFILPIWYNFGQARSCYDSPAQFFVRAPGYDYFIPEPKIQEYGETGWIEREGEVRLRIFSAGVTATAPPPVYPLETLEPAFDDLTTPQHFIQQAEPSRPIVTQFGPAIQFLGYDLPAATVTPGATLYVNLYWQALQPPGDNYRAFVHLTDGTQLWGQQDDNPACRLPTSIWRPGQRGLGQFRLPVKPETPLGRYPLIVGLYQADTLQRLKITAGAGKIGDDFLWLGDIEVREK